MEDNRKRSSFYVWDFLKSLMKLRKIPIVIYLLIDSIFTFLGIMIILMLFFSGQELTGTLVTILIVVSLLIYFGAIALSLSPIGEWVLRINCKCKPIEDAAILSRVEPLFNEVYARAQAQSSAVSDGIKLFIQDEAEANAFAVGRKSICITTGLLQLPDDQIKAVLAHEFGHLAHKDTDLNLVVIIANLFINVMFAIAWAVLIFYKVICKIITFFFSLSGETGAAIVGKITDITFSVIAFVCVRLVQKLWNCIGSLLLMFASKGEEFNADEFSYNLGYGKGLIDFFNTLPDARHGSRRGFVRFFRMLATIGDSHPATWKRIEKLKALDNGIDIDVISEDNSNDFVEISTNN